MRTEQRRREIWIGLPLGLLMLIGGIGLQAWKNDTLLEMPGFLLAWRERSSSRLACREWCGRCLPISL